LLEGSGGFMFLQPLKNEYSTIFRGKNTPSVFWQFLH
jgi:hypothetical protein